jgi:uncharacterized protein
MDKCTSLRSRLIDRIDTVAPDAWNALTDSRFPFLTHEFLNALERQECLGERTGWFPRHLLVEDENGALIAAMPMYLKTNSFGEFVFDWAWADAYRQAGLAYYPKLVVAAPFTPATGPRVLIADKFDRQTLYPTVVDTAIDAAAQLQVSSLHWLFTSDQQFLSSQPLLIRLGCQFHWENRNYADFEDFLSTLTSKRRKQIRKERREASSLSLEVRRIPGNEVDSREWRSFHHLYQSTFDKHGNYPALTLGFFQEVAATMGEQTLLVLAYQAKRIVAASYFLVGRDTLYGRYWGCFERILGLHFELCYYQGIEFCIENRLERFEPGAQGEHKISRGFLPTETWSLHWVRDPRFRAAIADFLDQETVRMHTYIADLSTHSPFKADTADDAHGSRST